MRLRKKPRTMMFPMAFVTSTATAEILGKEIEKDTIHLCDWHMPVSRKPRMYAIAVPKGRFISELIMKSHAFAVHFLPPLEKTASFCKSYSGRYVDKFQKTGLTRIPAERIEGSRIKEAHSFLECELADHIEQGDHHIFIGTVVHQQLAEPIKQMFMEQP